MGVKTMHLKVIYKLICYWCH